MLGAMMACDRLLLQQRQRAVLRVRAALKQGRMYRNRTMHLSWLNTKLSQLICMSIEHKCGSHIKHGGYKCSLGSKKKRTEELYYSIRPKISVAFASRETTLTKYILKNINIYDT
jgi:hypothetical protein